MPRISKKLPPNRADYSFGDLVYWHLFIYGTRPDGDPSAKAGRTWDASAIGELIGISDRTLRNWINDKHLPDRIGELEQELFGDNRAWDDARLELAEALRRTRDRKRGKPAAGTSSSPGIASPALLPDISGEEEPETSPADDGKSSEKPDAKGKFLVISERQRGAETGDEAPGNDPNPGGKLSGSPRRTEDHGHRRRNIAALAVTGLTVALGMFVWAQRPPSGPTSASLPSAPSSGPVGSPPPETGGKSAVPQTEAPLPPRTEEEQRADAERRIREQTVEALKKAHDRDMREREEEAKRLDREGPSGAAARVQRDREWNARMVAGMGFRLLEYSTVTGISMGHVPTETVYDCALSCLADKCDAFAWFRDERPGGARTCFRYKDPVTFYDHPGYTAGKKTSSGSGSAVPPVRLAQAGPPTPTGSEDNEVTHCPNGPVKVSGFTLTCDQILGGGTTLGSNRLAWTVANINECAAKCRPIKNCVGFTFNAAEQGGHACYLFGPTPQPRDSQGWISGTR